MFIIATVPSCCVYLLQIQCYCKSTADWIPREKQGNGLSALLGKDTVLCKNLPFLQHLRGRICQVICLLPYLSIFATQMLPVLPKQVHLQGWQQCNLQTFTTL